MNKLESDLDKLFFEVFQGLHASIAQNKEEIESQIEHWESALDELKNKYEISGELGSRAQALIERIQEPLTRLYELRDQVTQLTDPPLRTFTIVDAPSELALDYLALSSHFEDRDNAYYLIELFVQLVKSGFAPPKWALDEIADRFAKHLRNPDPELLADQLGLLGHSRDVRQLCADRSNAILHMSILVSHFGLSEIDAADAVVEMHDLKNQYGEPLSKHSMKNFFRKHFPDTRTIMKHPKGVDIAQVMTPVERTKFLSSVPVRIRKKIKAG